MSHRVRWAAALVLLVSAWGGPPAVAATHHAPAPHPRLVAHLSPATAYVGSQIVVSGTVKPATHSVAVERLTGHTWRVVAHARPSATGTYSVTTKVPRTHGIWAYRVVAGAATSRSLKVRVTTSIYHLTMTVPSAVDVGQPVQVSGVVKPRSKGVVRVQQLVGKVWVEVGHASLTATSTYAAGLILLEGSYRIRVVTPASRLVAGGFAKAATVQVLPPVAVTSTTLARASLSHPYSAQLTATGGSGPYTWRFEGSQVKAGLVLSSTGVLAGTPNLVGESKISALVTDALGQTAQADFTLIVTPRYGPVQAWGGNVSGAIGDGTTTNRGSPVPVSGISTATSVVAGGGTTLALLADGTVQAWGLNDEGQLGDGSTAIQRSTPGPVPGVTDVVGIAASGFDGYALRRDGTVWAWGSNFYGNLGDGTHTDRHAPGQVHGLTGITALAASSTAAYALDGQGNVWAWGRNGSGELGDGSFDATTLPVKVALTHVVSVGSSSNATGYAVTADGGVWTWGDNGDGELGTGSVAPQSNVPVQVPGVSGAVQVAGGLTAGYALTADGNVYSWGGNYWGQLGTGGGPQLTPYHILGLPFVAAITASRTNGYALLADGSVEAWGNNTDGELGNGTIGSSSATPAVVPGLSLVSSIDAGESTVLALQAPPPPGPL